MPTTETEICTSDDPAQIKTHAKALMRRRGVADSWDFAWRPRAKKSLGCCDPMVRPHLMQDKGLGEVVKKGEIKLSRKLFVGLGMETMMEHGVRENMLTDTILHEIAHALDFEARGKSDHSAAWRRHAREVGADPTRVAHMPKSVTLLIAKWVRYCPTCGNVSRMLFRKPNGNARARSCGECSDSFDPEHELKIRRNEHQVV